MKIFSKLWFVFAIIGTVATFLNPYIGFFGFINVTELFILFCFWINILVRERVVRKHPENKPTKIALKSLGIAIYMIAVMFFISKTFAAVVLFKLSYGSNRIMAPYEIWSNPNEMSIVFFIIEMLFNIVLFASLICKGTDIRRGCDE